MIQNTLWNVRFNLTFDYKDECDVIVDKLRGTFVELTPYVAEYTIDSVLKTFSIKFIVAEEMEGFMKSVSNIKTIHANYQDNKDDIVMTESYDIDKLLSRNMTSSYNSDERLILHIEGIVK